jgi:thioesterase domain-containing protein/acyl carrier protein
VAYTLQVGREAMAERLAMLVDSMGSLKEKLQGFVAGEAEQEDVYRGQVKGNEEGLSMLTLDEGMSQATAVWVAKKKYGKLLALWVMGLSIDWHALYPEAKPRKISLPSYPFERERYWIPEPTSNNQALDLGQVIHPLLHQNTSNFTKQRYSTRLSGEEFYLSDHLVNGQRVVPELAYLEMARAAVLDAMDEASEAVQLKNLVWSRPIVAGETEQVVHIGLYPPREDEIGFEVYTEGTEGEAVVHCQGQARLNGLPETLPAVDLVGLRRQCTQGHLEGAACYEALKTVGIDYGAAYQGLEALYVGEGEVLAKMTLPPVVSDTLEHYVLHPSGLGSALQAAAGVLLLGDPGSSVLRYTALQGAQIRGRLTNRLWVHVCLREGKVLAALVYDANGHPLVKLEGLRVATAPRFLDTKTSVSPKFTTEDRIASSQTKNATSCSVGVVLSKGRRAEMWGLSVEECVEWDLKEHISGLLKIPLEHLDIQTNLADVGFDSISLTEMAKLLSQYYGIEVTPSIFLDHPTIEEIRGCFLQEYSEEVEAFYHLEVDAPQRLSKESRFIVPSSDKNNIPSNGHNNMFYTCPELVLLNSKPKGRPIFWIHAGLGGVEIYHGIAKRMKRPFYGVQAKGWLDDEPPLVGVYAMAQHYASILMTVQPEGPFDIGGYSVGGILSYEVTRILQMNKRKVNTITMIDSLDSTQFKKFKVSKKSMYLQAVNVAVDPSNLTYDNKPSLIDRSELDASLDDEQYLTDLMALARKRGLHKSSKQLQKRIESIVKVQGSYELDAYSLSPLSNPNEVNCYYFRNHNSVFFGGLEPYLILDPKEMNIDEKNYWQKWPIYLPNIKIIEVNTENHLMMLSDPGSAKTIIEFCENLYCTEDLVKSE